MIGKVCMHHLANHCQNPWGPTWARGLALLFHPEVQFKHWTFHKKFKFHETILDPLPQGSMSMWVLACLATLWSTGSLTSDASTRGVGRSSCNTYCLTRNRKRMNGCFSGRCLGRQTKWIWCVSKSIKSPTVQSDLSHSNTPVSDEPIYNYMDTTWFGPFQKPNQNKT